MSDNQPTKMGRPLAQIDRGQFESLCSIWCTEEEICEVFGVTVKTLNRWCREQYGATFSKVFKQKRVLGNVSLRRSQKKLAEKNVTMAIFLGKQYLGQRDYVEVAETYADDGFMKALRETAAGTIDQGLIEGVIEDGEDSTV